MLTRPLGRPKNRWEDDIRNDMKKLPPHNTTTCPLRLRGLPPTPAVAKV